MDENTMKNEETIRKMIAALESGDMKGFSDFYADDAVEEWPQSGERVVGIANIRAIDEAYPGVPKLTPRRVIASGDLVIAESTLDYGEGGVFNTVFILEVKDGKVVRETTYWGAPFEAPSWRSQWVEKLAA